MNMRTHSSFISILACTFILGATAAAAPPQHANGVPSEPAVGSLGQNSRRAGDSAAELAGPSPVGPEIQLPQQRNNTARWLSQQLQQPVEAAQVLVSPEFASFEGCTILRVRPAHADATSLSVRCPGRVLPQLVLLNIPPGELSVGTAAALPQHANDGRTGGPAKIAAPLVHAGTVLKAEWNTLAIRIAMPVVALEAGASGGEIQVRVPKTNRVLRARVLTAHSVEILGGAHAAGA